MLRTLLNLLNPYKKDQLRREPGFLQQVRVSIYKWCIKRLIRFYKAYSYYDIIVVGDVEIRQICRDRVFEEWLSQMKIDIASRLKPASTLPMDRSSSYWFRPFYKFFHFDRVTTIVWEGKTIVYDRTFDLSIVSDINGQLKLSDEKAIVRKSVFKTIVPNREKPSAKKIHTEENSGDSESHKKREKVSLGKVISVTTAPTTTDKETDTFIKKAQGVEIDESF